MKLRPIKLISIALALVILAGCSQSQILTTLKASVAATEVLVASLEATGKISSGLAMQIEDAIATLPSAFQQTTQELATTEAPAVKAAKITGYFASTLVSLNALPPQAQFWTSAVVSAINDFLAVYQPTHGLMAARPGIGATTSKPENAKELDKIRERAFNLANRLGSIRR